MNSHYSTFLEEKKILFDLGKVLLDLSVCFCQRNVFVIHKERNAFNPSGSLWNHPKTSPNEEHFVVNQEIKSPIQIIADIIILHYATGPPYHKGYQV